MNKILNEKRPVQRDGLHLPLKLIVFRAAKPLTPRIEHVVTQHELSYRYMPDTGN